MEDKSAVEGRWAVDSGVWEMGGLGRAAGGCWLETWVGDDESADSDEETGMLLLLLLLP